MVKAGEPVDEQIALLRPLLAKDDIIIDAGNANFRDTMRRFGELDGSGLTFIGMGVSGGEEGARHGPSIMVGGTPSFLCARRKGADRHCRQIQGRALLRLARPQWRRPFRQDHPQRHRICRHADDRRDLWRAARRAGHGAKAIGEIFAKWNKGRLNSYLIEITAAVLAADDPKTGKPMVDVIVDCAGQKGTGRWAVIEAQMMGVPATAIEAAVAARSLSAMKDEREAAERTYGQTAARSLGDRDALIDKIWNLRCLPARLRPMRKALRCWRRPRRNSPGTCRWPPSPASGGQAASSARSSSTPSPRPSQNAAPHQSAGGAGISSP